MVKKPPNSKPSKPTPRASKPGAAAAAAAEPISTSSPTSAEDLKAQQRLLNVFSDTFRPVLGAEDFDTVLQKVKQALYNRDFEAAFGDERFLDVYAARWSPPRALCYAAVLRGIRGELEALLLPTTTTTAATTSSSTGIEDEVDEVEFGRISPTLEPEESSPPSSPPPPPPPPPTATTTTTTTTTTQLKMLAIGGGAAEIVAFGEFLRDAGDAVSGCLTLLDTGPWGGVIEKLHTGLTTPPPLSKYASAAAKASSAALVAPAERLRSTFVRRDVLGLDARGLGGLLGLGREEGEPGPVLVTLLFTLNELYSSATGGIRLTTSFLRNLSAAVPVGSLLLVADSPGSYSEAAVGREAKKYPMQWLLDHTLLQADKLPAEGCRWEKLQSHDSIWFRLSEGLRYPMDLQDMRYQMHLYRACPRSSD
ncbi:hypothetical protein F4811DRAFT_549258 [Daldinia bambusicola]|nr:hypothetical protein F4811DRAFT_549258 [Daldinia bambusicola]